MTHDPVRTEVLAWLWSNPERTAREAARRFWPDLPAEAIPGKASLVRMWVTRTRRTADNSDADEPPPRAATPPSAGREAWLRDQAEALASDVERARRKSRYTDVARLTATLSDVHRELDAVVRAPPPTEAPTEPLQPLISDDQLAAMTDSQLAIAIWALLPDHDDDEEEGVRAARERLAELRAERQRLEGEIAAERQRLAELRKPDRAAPPEPEIEPEPAKGEVVDLFGTPIVLARQ